MSGQESGAATGTRDKDYNLIWFVEASLSNALRMQTLSMMPSVTGTAKWPICSVKPRARAAGVRRSGRSCFSTGSCRLPYEFDLLCVGADPTGLPEGRS